MEQLNNVCSGDMSGPCGCDVCTQSAHDAYVQVFVVDMRQSESDAVTFEEQCLSIGRDLLPQCAIDALDNDTRSEEYWLWLGKMARAAAYENNY